MVCYKGSVESGEIALAVYFMIKGGYGPNCNAAASTYCDLYCEDFDINHNKRLSWRALLKV